MKEAYMEMQEIKHEDYLEFVKHKSSVIIEDVEIKLHKNWQIKSYGPPSTYKLERRKHKHYIPIAFRDSDGNIWR